MVNSASSGTLPTELPGINYLIDSLKYLFIGNCQDYL